MPSLVWRQFIGQERIKEVFESAFSNDKLGHAYLLCGESGTGKFAAAMELCMAMLCLSESGKPCYTCDSCQKVLKYAHPDFHVLMPLALSKEHRGSDGKLTDEGWKLCSDAVCARINDPYKLRIHSGIPSIPLEWIKEMNHAIIRGALEGGRNVAILDGIDVLNKESANAMLKTLEEPPPGTLMLLMTEKIHAVLPTIISRCQLLRFSYLSPEIISGELSKKFGLSSDDKRIQRVVHTGSLGQSIYLFENPVEEISSDAMEFWALCKSGEWLQVASFIDKFSQLDDFNSYEKLFIQIMHLIRNAFFNKLRGTENYIMGDRSLEVDIGNQVAPEKIDDLIRQCEDALGQIRARANISLVLVNFAMSLMEIHDEQKQQVG